MADYIVKDTELTSVANAIRTAGGTNSLLSFPNGFVSAVGNISGGGSSDFSTAQVTLQCNVNEEVTVDAINFAYLNGDRLLTSLQLYNGFDYTITTVLYKSKASTLFYAQGAKP